MSCEEEQGNGGSSGIKRTVEGNHGYLRQMFHMLASNGG